MFFTLESCIKAWDKYIKQISIELLFNYRLVNESFEECVAFQRALKEFVASADPTYSKQHEEFFVGFDGRFVHSSIISGKSNMIVWESFFTKIYKFYNHKFSCVYLSLTFFSNNNFQEYGKRKLLLSVSTSVEVSGNNVHILTICDQYCFVF